MKELTLWMVRRYLPGFRLIVSPVDEAVARALISECLPHYHLARNPKTGADRKPRKTTVQPLEKEAHEDPQAETLGD